MIRQILHSSFYRLPFSVGKTRPSFQHFTTLNIKQNRALSAIAKSPLLSPRAKPSLSSVEKEVRAKPVDFNAFTVAEVSRRLPNFSDADWREYLSVLVAKSNLARKKFNAKEESEYEAARQIRDGACQWLAKNMDTLKPDDFYYLLRYLSKPSVLRMKETMPKVAHENIRKWLLKNLAVLEPHNFFEIIKYISAHLRNYGLLGKENADDIAMVINRGMELLTQDNSEVIHIIHLLHFVEEHIQANLPNNDSRLAMFSQKLVKLLEKKELPANRNDLYELLLNLSDSRSAKKGSEKLLTYRSLFRRHAEGNSAAWKWLRNAIELVFKNDEYADMRQMAALVAVRAYKWKAIDFSPDDVDRFLQQAAKPFLTDPTVFFELPQKEISFKKSYAFGRLVYGIRSAAVSDLPQLGKLSVRLDDAFWKRFFDVVEKEQSNLGRNIFAISDLSEISSLSAHEKRFLSLPSKKEIAKVYKKAQEKYSIKETQ